MVYRNNINLQHLCLTITCILCLITGDAGFQINVCSSLSAGYVEISIHLCTKGYV